MKNFAFLALAFISFIGFSANAQQIQRCITEEKMQDLFQRDPQAKIRYENTRRMLDAKVVEYLSNPSLRLNRMNALINVPVVVHVALSNPNLITDATIQSQIDTLNWYFGGQSSTDSLRVYTPFRTSFGRSQIRFCMAQRTPTNQPTNGIVRVTTSTTFSSGGAHPSTVAPAWNTDQYLNIWVVNFGTSGILGYAYKPGAWPAGDQRIGFVNDYRAFGSNAAYLFANFNLGRTAVHEIGHFFNLDHTWGPNNNSDPTCTLDDGCTDTPNTNGPYFGCPTAAPPVTSTSCLDTGPDGIMWQNHMDYSDDRCMILFTAQQVARMDLALTAAPDRIGLTTSPGCQPLVVSSNDAGVSAVINPVNGKIYCSPGITPQATLGNFGTATLTTVDIRLTINGVLQAGYPYTWNGSLAQNATANVTLPAINLVSGNNSIVVSTTAPNGGSDDNTGNDATAITVSLLTLNTLPVTEGFEGTTFPPEKWAVNNPNNNNTWVKRAPGRISNNSAFIDNYNFSLNNQTDDMRSPYLSVSGADSLIFSFDLAHKYYPSTGFHDTLSVLVSTDCGNTFTSVYKKWGATLATAGSSTSNYSTPAPTDWRNERVALNNSYTASGSALFLFRNTNRSGNNIFLDNINILGLYRRDIQLVSINTPGTLVCNGSFTPNVTIRNVGSETVTGVKVTYSLNNGAPQTTTLTGLTLARDNQTTVNLAPVNVTTVGSHTLRVYSWDPITSSGTGDQNTYNDSLIRVFSLAGNIQAPLNENFTGTTIPPTGWTVLNPDNSITWSRYANGNGNAGSAFVNTYNYPVFGQRDELISPNVSYTGADSIKLTFDLSAATYSYPGSTTIGLDTLEVLVSKDCGATFTSVYKKWGEDLQTVKDPNGTQLDEFFAAEGTWRKETIDLTSTGSGGPMMVFFRITSNYENNVFIDNVNLTTRVLPDQLKQKGYLVLPSPFQNNIGVWHLQTPSTLKYINVYNSAGQLVWTKQFSGNAQKMEMVDLSGKAAGVYVVNVGYDDANRNTSERVVKQ